MRITAQQRRTKATYKSTRPKFLGNLHERMQLVMSIATPAWRELPPDLCTALCDLETELSFYKPVEPPYGQRDMVTL